VYVISCCELVCSLSLCAFVDMYKENKMLYLACSFAGFYYYYYEKWLPSCTIIYLKYSWSLWNSQNSHHHFSPLTNYKPFSAEMCHTAQPYCYVGSTDCCSQKRSPTFFHLCFIMWYVFTSWSWFCGLLLSDTIHISLQSVGVISHKPLHTDLEGCFEISI
jgi:hypothetical protein